MSSPYSRDPAGNRCWRYVVVDICVMIRGPWVYLESLREALDGAFALDVQFAPFEDKRAVDKLVSTESQCVTSDLLKISNLEPVLYEGSVSPMQSNSTPTACSASNQFIPSPSSISLIDSSASEKSSSPPYQLPLRGYSS